VGNRRDARQGLGNQLQRKNRPNWTLTGGDR
jgi:hypothetical protein